MQRPAPASSVVLLSRVQAPAGHLKQVKLEALKHLGLCAEDIHQPARVAVPVGALA